MILWLTKEAINIGLSYVYLGYWIKNSNKMAYKTRFKPIEILSSSGWINYEDKIANYLHQS
jgi:arginine-tRNA-protein transferase